MSTHTHTHTHTQGGFHVSYIVDQVVSKLLEAANKKNRGGGGGHGPEAPARQESPVGVCELSHREPLLRLTDQGEHDAQGKIRWLHLQSQ